MITHLELHRFKCFKELKLDPARITIFIGKNGTGKSSVLQALACLRQSVGASDLVTDGELVSLGTFLDVTFGFEPGATIDIVLAGQRVVSSGSAIGYATPLRVEYSYAGTFGPSLLAHRGQVAFDRTTLSGGATGDEPGQVRSPNAAITYGPSQAVCQPLKVGGVQISDHRLRSGAERAARDLVEAITVEVSGLSSVPALRGFSAAEFGLGDDSMPVLNPALPHAQVSQGLATTLAYQQTLDHQLSVWLKRITGVAVSTRVRPRKLVTVEVLSGGQRVKVVNQGFGTNQLVWLLTVVALAPSESTVLVEEPETHLHPKAQTDLVSVLADIARERGLQFILTTHSEHILYKVLALVAKGELHPKDVAVYEFDLDEGNVAHATRLEVTDRGQVKGGLRGFFDVTLDEMDGYMKALLAKGRS